MKHLRLVLPHKHRPWPRFHNERIFIARFLPKAESHQNIPQHTKTRNIPLSMQDKLITVQHKQKFMYNGTL